MCRYKLANILAKFDRKILNLNENNAKSFFFLGGGLLFFDSHCRFYEEQIQGLLGTNSSTFMFLCKEITGLEIGRTCWNPQILLATLPYDAWLLWIILQSSSKLELAYAALWPNSKKYDQKDPMINHPSRHIAPAFYFHRTHLRQSFQQIFATNLTNRQPWKRNFLLNTLATS